jgi:hypothetical protein
MAKLFFQNASDAFKLANPHLCKISDPEPQPDKASALVRANAGKAQSFTGYRVRPLDPDNFAGSCKDLLDGCRHAGLIPGDEPWRTQPDSG